MNLPRRRRGSVVEVIRERIERHAIVSILRDRAGRGRRRDVVESARVDEQPGVLVNVVAHVREGGRGQRPVLLQLLLLVGEQGGGLRREEGLQRARPAEGHAGAEGGVRREDGAPGGADRRGGVEREEGREDVVCCSFGGREGLENVFRNGGEVDEG